jgi:hypothetical protein
MDIVMDEETWLTTGTVWAVNMETGTLTKTTVTLGEYDPTYGTYVILEGITAESYLADPADAGVKEGAAVHMLGELEYMGQTEPVPTTEPTGETGEVGEIVEPVPPEVPAEPEGGDVEFEIEVTPTEGGQQDAPLNIGTGSLVFPTEDPEKQ